MNDDVERQIPSPCIRKCCLNDDDICLGCFRSLEEIIRWSESGDEMRRNILQEAELRKKSHHRKWGKGA